MHRRNGSIGILLMRRLSCWLLGHPAQVSVERHAGWWTNYRCTRCGAWA